MRGLYLLYRFLWLKFEGFYCEWKQSRPFPTTLQTMGVCQNILILIITHEIFPSEYAPSYGFYLVRTSLYVIYFITYINFFYENYWPHLTSSSKSRGSVGHSDLKFWFSGNANTGRHCLLLKFHLSF